MSVATTQAGLLPGAWQLWWVPDRLEAARRGLRRPPCRAPSTKRQAYTHRGTSLRRFTAANSAVHDPAPGCGVCVVGAGAAGLTAAYFAALQGADVTLLERCSEAGRKVLISGGTRCNVLPGGVDLARDYVTESSQSALHALFSSWSLEECQAWLHDPGHVGLALAREQETDKWFPVSNSAREVRDRLLAACQRVGVRLAYDASVEHIEQGPANSWRCHLRSGATHTASRLVLTTGGLSFPTLGTDGTGLRLLQRLGLPCHPPYPALTPLRGGHPGGTPLAGLSVYNVAISAAMPGKPARRAQRTARAAMLFTHRGFSGPAVLDLSHTWVRAHLRATPAPVLQVNWTREEASVWEQRLCAGGPGGVASMLRRNGVPARLAAALCREAGCPEGCTLAQLARQPRARLLALLSAYPLQVDGHEGYAKAEVTGGGLALSAVDCASLELRAAPGLHVAGELLDVFGRIGGFNFYWAWLSGRLAGLAAGRAAAP